MSITSVPLNEAGAPPAGGPPKGYSHQFHAEAHALSGELRAPIRQVIEPHVPVELNDERGGHLTRFTEDVSIEGLITLNKAHTRVSGSKSEKHEAWVTLSTTVVEGFNVFEVITADRVVAQVSTEHTYVNGHVPSVTFLGTKFENLKVSGIPVVVKYNFGVCGTKPKDDTEPYVSNRDLLEKTEKRVQKIVDSGFLFGEGKKLYDKRLAEIRQLIREKKGHRLTCSLVESIDITEVQKQIPNVKTVGHVLVIPDFGAVSLGEIEVGLEKPKPSRANRPLPGAHNGNSAMSNYFELTMLNMELGCVGTASIKGVQTKTNGNTSP
jgi:hypothetical protein